MERSCFGRKVVQAAFFIILLVVILGRQQLFTENTLTPVLSLFHRKDRETLLNVARLWIVVLLANMAVTQNPETRQPES